MKILVVSHNSFSKTHNNGKTLSAIFSCFKKDELCQLFFTPIGIVDIERCDQYYLIKDKDAVRSIFFRRRCGSTQFPVVNEDYSAPTKAVRYEILNIARSIFWWMSAWYRGGLDKWLEFQNPDVVFYVGGEPVFSHKIAVKISTRRGIPLISYFTDDYVLNRSQSLYIKYVISVYKQTIERSSLQFAIGKRMASEYSAYFGKAFYPIMNIVKISPEASLYVCNMKEISICYFGGLHLGRDRELLRFATFLNHYIRPNIEAEISLKIFTFSSLTDQEIHEMEKVQMIYMGAVEGERLKQEMQKTDIFLHVESTEKKYMELTRLSVSTKIPEYMALSKPILAFGPEDLASFEVIKEACPKMVINDTDSEIEMENQAKALIPILSDGMQLMTIGQENYHYAKSNFDGEKVSWDFRDKIVEILNTVKIC